MSDQSDGAPGEFGVPGGFRPGSHIASYQLEERLGQGGMAVVFRAYDSRLDRRVALKLMAPGLSDDDAFRQRFIRESRAAAAVDDPHIIPVFEAGEADGVLFLAMRLVRGGDVRSLIDRNGPLPPARAAEIVAQVASALDAAHARGLVHRDVKPANMLLEAAPGADRPDHVYLSDFGLTKTSLAASGLTATGQFMGTVEYVAPEQIEGRPLDGRCDQYALACSAFEMLCGEPPFRREQSISVLFAHMSEAPPQIRLRRPELPDDIEAVLAKALSKAPADRYATCGEFASAVRAALTSAGSGPGGAPAGRQATEIAMPGAGGPAAPDAAAGAQPPWAAATSQPPAAESAGGPTQAAGYPARARPTDPSAGQRDDTTRPALAAAARADPHRAAGPDGAGIEPGQPRRPWWRGRVPVAGIAVLALLLGGGGYVLASGGNKAADSHKGSGHSSAPGSSGRTAAALPLPPCSTATATATSQPVTATSVAIGGQPFGLGVTPDGQYSFVSTGSGLAILRNDSSTGPVLLRTIAAGADGEVAVTPDGRFAVAAAGSGAVVVNVSDAVAGQAVVATLSSRTGKGPDAVLVTADGYAFVTMQKTDEVAVFKLARATGSGDFIGFVPTGKQPVGLTAAGSTLYVTNLKGNTITLVDLNKAKSSPAASVLATVPVGCGPARALVSPDGKVLWVTSRLSNTLLGFSMPRLRSDPGHALIAKVAVGAQPIGEAFIDRGAKIVVGDSNLGAPTGPASNLAVISTARALARKPALLGYVPTGEVPRRMTVLPGGKRLLVTESYSHELQAFSVADLP
jgi:DNA-binding beta-propeller fold protein YncE/tRNA A-37 threonylcarbamoyl transferase component Bud32